MKSRQHALIAVTALVVGCAAYFWYLRSRDPEAVAMNALQAFINSRPDRIYSFHSEAEAKLTGISEERFVKLWKQLVAPLVAKTTISKKFSSERLNDPVTQGLASVELELPDGTLFSWPMSAWVTDSEPRMQCLWNTVGMTWILRSALADPKAYRSGMSFAQAKLKGLREDRSYLESLGITGMVAESGAYLTWDQLESEYVRQIKLRMESIEAHR